MLNRFVKTVFPKGQLPGNIHTEYDYIHMETTPYGEDCIQFGPDYDKQKAMRECIAFINQIMRTIATPDNCGFAVAENPHDLGQCGVGVYYDVRVLYPRPMTDDEKNPYIDWALSIEGAGIELWDDMARVELGLTPRNKE